MIFPHCAVKSRIFWRSLGVGVEAAINYPALELPEPPKRISPRIVGQSSSSCKAGPDLFGRSAPVYLVEMAPFSGKLLLNVPPAPVSRRTTARRLLGVLAMPQNDPTKQQPLPSELAAPEASSPVTPGPAPGDPPRRKLGCPLNPKTPPPFFPPQLRTPKTIPSPSLRRKLGRPRHPTIPAPPWAKRTRRCPVPPVPPPWFKR